jgi:hypothetical protein
MALFVATFTFFERNRRGRTESVVLAQFAGWQLRTVLRNM